MLRSDESRARLISYTMPNLQLDANTTASFPILNDLWARQGTWAETIVEFAGRVCYHSTPRMGTAPDFISSRIREGHEDIIEHVWATVEFQKTYEPSKFKHLNRHCEVSNLADGVWIVSANLRVWLEFFRSNVGMDAFDLLYWLAPSVFSEIRNAETNRGIEIKFADLNWEALHPIHDEQMKVALLGFTQSTMKDRSLLLKHGHATFFFDGISRACTHQLVRHRLASFSQESQRYVDMEKGGWNLIVPDSFKNNQEAVHVLEEFWEMAQEKYEELRSLGVRKEDARFLLPNATETRIVVSMNYEAWSHFFWLRAVDKAAQWEIRKMAQYALYQLYTISPIVFQEHWKKMLSTKDVLLADFSHGIPSLASSPHGNA